MPRLRITVLALMAVALATGCGTATTTPSPRASIAPPSVAATAAAGTIDLSEWKVAVSSTLKAGSSTFTINNKGIAPHELLIFKSDLAPSAYPVDSAGTIDEEGTGVTLTSDGANIDPSGTQSRTVDLKAGTYLFVCNIPGHFKQGMFTVVTVS